MLFQDIVDVSKRVRATTRQKEKVSLMAGCLKRGQGQEIALAASYLSGQIPRGSLGIGWAFLQKTLGSLDERPRPLTLLEVNRHFDEVAQSRGAGSVAKKIKALRDLFSLARKDEKEFLRGLIMGEVRQGALEGLVVEAVAQASALAVERIQQGVMFSGNIGGGCQGRSGRGPRRPLPFSTETFPAHRPHARDCGRGRRGCPGAVGPGSM